jgi:hypothetical protein
MSSYFQLHYRNNYGQLIPYKSTPILDYINTNSFLYSYRLPFINMYYTQNKRDFEYPFTLSYCFPVSRQYSSPIDLANINKNRHENEYNLHRLHSSQSLEKYILQEEQKQYQLERLHQYNSSLDQFRSNSIDNCDLDVDVYNHSPNDLDQSQSQESNLVNEIENISICSDLSYMEIDEVHVDNIPDRPLSPREMVENVINEVIDRYNRDPNIDQLSLEDYIYPNLNSNVENIIDEEPLTPTPDQSTLSPSISYSNSSSVSSSIHSKKSMDSNLCKHSPIVARRFRTINKILKEQESCPICFDNMHPHDDKLIMKKKCKHIFHTHCLSGWRFIQRRHDCPLCRNHCRTYLVIKSVPKNKNQIEVRFKGLSNKIKQPMRF